MDMPSSDNVKKQQEYVNRTWNKEDLGNLWESLFDYDRLSKCRQNDLELQSAAILLKKTFHLFKGLKQRCDEAEEACDLRKQEKCQQCVRLLEENAVQKQKLKNMEDRLKAVARMLNLDGGAEERSPMLKNPHHMQALTQAFLGSDPAVTDDNTAKSPPVDATSDKRSVSPARSPRRKKPRWRDTQHQDVPETVPSERRQTTRRNIVIPETLCESQCHDKEQTLDFDDNRLDDEMQERQLAENKHDNHTPTKTSSDVHREPLEDVRETRIEEDPDVTQTLCITRRPTSGTPLKQSTSEEPCNKSPIIGRSSSTKRSRSFRRYANLTQSAEVVSLNMTPETHKLNDFTKSPLSRLAMSVGVPRSFDEVTGPGSLQVSPKNAGNELDVSLDESPSILSSVGIGRGNTSNLKNKVKENVMDVSNKSGVGKGITKASLAKESGKVKLGERKQADYWQLQPTSSVQSVTVTGKGSKLKQTKLSLGVFPKKTDLSSLSEFNGGVRPSQSQTRREFERGVTLTSTLVDDKRIASDLLEGLNDSDFLSPSPKIPCSIPRRCADSQANKSARKGLNLEGTVNNETFYQPPKAGNGSNLQQDKANTIGIRPLDKVGSSTTLPRNQASTSHVLPQANVELEDENVEDLLHEMGIPETPRTKELFQSFDRIPNKNKNEPNFKYKGDVVRKKDDRMKLEGWDCHECKEFFVAAGLDTAKQKMLMNKCSRHRDKNERLKSPDRYWEVGFPSTQECRERNLNITQSGKPLRSRKKKTDNVL